MLKKLWLNFGGKNFSLPVKASYLMLEIKELGCYEVKIEESEKGCSCRESNTGHLRLEYT